MGVKPASAQLTIGSDGLWIKKETLFSVNGLEFEPAAMLNLAETEVQRSATPVTFYGLPSISQVYTFSTPITFAGVLRLHYKPSVLDGAAASDLQLIYEESDGGPLKLVMEADVNTKDQYVASEFDDPITVQLLTATAFGITTPEISDVALTLSAPLQVGNTLAAAYTFTDANPDDEDHSTVVWYRYDAPSGDVGKTAIPDATGKSYTLVAADIGKFISFEVTAHDGTVAGATVESNRQGAVHEQGIRYVKQGATGNGYSWTDASGDLQAMINASSAGDEVWVAVGEYQRGAGQSFSMKEGVKIYGGFPSVGTPGMDERDWEEYETVLKGNSNSVVRNDDNGVTATAILDGFTVTGGSAAIGGGIYNGHVSPTFTNLIISGNTASANGGGMGNETASPTLTNVLISGNKAPNYGGIAFRDPANAILTNVTITGNYADVNGGGIAIEKESTVTLINSIIWNNRAGGNTNSTDASVYRNGTLHFSNSLIANSRDGNGVWRAAIGTDGGGNIDGDPLFIDGIDPATAPSPEGDFTLQPGSPAINAGDPQTNESGYPVQVGATDLAGRTRVVDGQIDIGAYERPFRQQTIDVADLEDGKLTATYGDADFVPVVTTSTGGPAIFSLPTEDNMVASIVDGKIHIMAAGEVELTVSVAGTTEYDPTSIALSLVVAKKVLTITADGEQNKVYGSADPALTYSATGFVGDDDENLLEGALSRETGEDVDTYTIVQGTIYAGDNYMISYTAADFSITPKSLTVTVDAGQGKVYGSTDPVLTYTAAGFERDDDASIFTGVLSREAGEDVDTYAIMQGTLDAGDNYTMAYTGANFAITPKELVVKADAGQGKVYGSADPVLTYTATGFEWDDDEGILGGVLSRASGEDVDTYAIGQGTLDAGDNYTISYTSANFEITPKELVVKADARQSKVYGSADPVLTYTATGFERDDDEVIFAGALSREAGEGVDSYSIGIGTLAAGSNYTISYTAADFAITPRVLTIKADAEQGKVYGSADPELTYTATGFERDDDEGILGGVLSRGSGEDVDTYAITKGTLDAGDNYTIAYTGANFVITPKSLTVTADAGQGKVYGSANPALTYKAIGFERDDDASIFTGALSREAGEDVDTYAITQGTLSAGANYTIAYTGANFAITAKTLTVTADADQSKVYGSADPALTFDAAGLEWDDDESILTGALSRAPGEDVDSYAIGQGTLAVGSNYTISYTASDFAITPKSLTVTVNAGQGKVYGSADPELTYTATGFERDDDGGILGGVLSRASGEDVDTYAIGQGTLDAGDNYTISYTSANFEITPKELVVKADAGHGKVYGSTDPALTYAATGFERDDDEGVLTGALSREAGEDVDTYAITKGTLSAGANYTIAYTGANFAITAKTLTVMADADQSKVYGSADPILTFDAVGFGWNDDESVLTGALSRAPGEDVDNYAIGRGTLAVGSNYTINYTAADFTITPKSLTVTTDSGQGKVYGSVDPVFTYTATGFAFEEDEHVFTGTLSRVPGEDVDSYSIGIGTLVAGDNYTIAYTDADFAITPKPLAVTLSNMPEIVKVYDGTYVATLVAANYMPVGGLPGDDLEITGTAVYRDKDAGTDKEIVVLDFVLDGADADNYRIITTSTTTTGVITAKPLTVALDDYPLITKVYDGSAAVTLHADNYSLGGIVGEDDVSVKGTATYEDGNAGTEREITVSGFMLHGADKDNYTVEAADAFTTGTITPKELRVSVNNIPVIEKVYDGNNVAVLAADNYVLTGMVDGDDVTVSGAAIYDDADVGEEKVVTVTGFELGSTHAGNYVFDTDSATTTGRITAGPASARHTGFEISPAQVGRMVTITITVRDMYGNPVSTVSPAAFSVSVSGANNISVDVIHKGDGTYSATYTPESGGLDELSVLLDGTAVSGVPYRYPVSDFPGAPSGLRAEAGNRQVMLEWDPPADLPPTVTDYMIEYSRDEGTTWTVPDREPSAATRSLVIGLENNRPYVFRISAVSAIGTGAASGTVQAIPTEPVLDGEGNLPEPEPGTPVVITDGKVEAVTLEVIDGEYLKLSGDDYAIKLASLGMDGERIPISAVDAIIRLLRGAGARVHVSGHGFEPGTVVTVYLFPNLELVGHLPVDSDGNFGGSLPVPASLELGHHTLQANGVVAGGGGERSVSVGLERVDRKPQWVEFGAPAGQTYGDDPVTLDGKSTSGLAVAYTATDMDGKPTNIAVIENNKLTIRGAGDILITASQVGNGDYSAASPVSRTLHIAKAPLAVSVADAARAYGGANPSFDVSYNGFVDGEDASSLDRAPSASTDATETSAPGSYAITVSGGVSANYAFTYHDATLTVTKAPQAITFNAPAEVTRDAGSIQLDVSASSGLLVALSLDDPQVTVLDGTTLDILRLGTVTITATQVGDGNYEAADPVTVTVRVVDPSSDFPVRVHRALSPNGDGINEYLVIEAIKDHPDNRVTIVNRNGTVLWEASGYDNDRVVFRGISTGQQQLPAGTYFYIVEVKVDGKREHRKGYFVIRY
ncbi:MBG domain-containing protein [Parapedobacter indicus]|uniref:MBG domain-containing protein n=1 Tax=Parapedobacter indicus TaxID=1477437 RepID=UPI0015A643FF|nr:MBG domain-containing protein [Parapedobacter indicus]